LPCAGGLVAQPPDIFIQINRFLPLPADLSHLSLETFFPITTDFTDQRISIHGICEIRG
jgi:hypothetical protein